MNKQSNHKFSYTPDVKIKALGPKFYDKVKAADFPKTILRYRNDEAAKSVGLDGFSDAQWMKHFGRFAPLKNNLKTPLALRYHGHQFRHYNPDIGDGRGFLFAQMRGGDGCLLDLGTKGSGRTPHSRAGDGRLTLLGGVREVLATAYLEALGVNTSKTLSLIETGEELQRSDEPSPTRSAVMVRLSHSHIRFGTFQRAAFENNKEGMENLVAYCFEYYYPDIADKTPASLLAAVSKASAETVASWMVAGFVHGVMNTDNMNITGESFDYGPFRFSPTLQAARTAAYFDHQSLYAFGRQPETMYWNLAQLASAFTLITDEKPVVKVLDNFPNHYSAALRTAFFKRLGMEPGKDANKDMGFINSTFLYLENSQAGLAQFYYNFRGGAGRLKQALKGPNKTAYEGQEFKDWLKVFKTYEPNAKAPDTDVVTIIHEEIEALWAPIAAHDDWSLFERKLTDIKVAV